MLSLVKGYVFRKVLKYLAKEGIYMGVLGKVIGSQARSGFLLRNYKGKGHFQSLKDAT